MELTSFAVYCPCSRCRGKVRQHLVLDVSRMQWLCPVSKEFVCAILGREEPYHG